MGNVEEVQKCAEDVMCSVNEQYKGFCLGNVIKYSCRANFKGNFGRDMEKAGFYGKFIQEHEEERWLENMSD